MVLTPMKLHPRKSGVLFPYPRFMVKMTNGRKLHDMKPNENAEFLRTWTGMSIYAIAKKMGTDPSSFDKRVKNRLTADLIIEVSRATHQDPIEGLRLAGMIPDESARDIDAMLNEAMRLLKEAKRLSAGQGNVVPLWKNQPSDDEIVQEANEYPAAAQERTERLDEPDNP